MVCTKIPETNPNAVAMPYFFPLEMLWVRTYRISGPGESVKAMEARRKGSIKIMNWEVIILSKFGC
jgi:hypothetical protein